MAWLVVRIRNQNEFRRMTELVMDWKSWEASNSPPMRFKYMKSFRWSLLGHSGLFSPGGVAPLIKC